MVEQHEQKMDLEIDGNIRENLKILGFTDYYINLYIGLLIGGEQNARELSELTGVPYSRIYKILNEMGEKGIITKIDGRPGTFVANDPQTVFENIKKQHEKLFEEKMSQSLPYLRSLYGDKQVNQIKLNIYRGKACLEHLRESINNTARRLIICMKYFEEILPKIEQNLIFIRTKGVQVKLLIEEKYRQSPLIDRIQKLLLDKLVEIRFIPNIQNGFIISDDREGIQGIKGFFNFADPNKKTFTMFSSGDTNFINYLREIFSQLWEMASPLE